MSILSSIGFAYLLRPCPETGTSLVIASLAAVGLGAFIWVIYLMRKVQALSVTGRTALQSTAEGVLVVDNNGKMVAYNSRFIERWSIPEAILNSRDDALAVVYAKSQLKDPDMFAATVRDAYDHRDIRYDDVLELIDGRVFEFHSEPQPSSQRNCKRGWAFRDMTEARRFERDLAQERNLLRILIESLPDYIYVKDTEGMVSTREYGGWRC